MQHGQQASRVESFPGYDSDLLCYWEERPGIWYLSIPGKGIANLARHTITVNPDGSITAEPSIMLTLGWQGVEKKIHGYLTWGWWKEIS